MSRIAAFVLGALAVTPALAGHKCEMTVKDIQAHLTRGAKMDQVSPRAFYFLEGVWALNPQTPAGLPPAAKRAFLMHKRGDDGGDVIFADGLTPDACMVGPPMSAPKALVKMIGEVESGPGDDL